MSEWGYNDRPDGVRFLPDQVAEPARTEIEDALSEDEKQARYQADVERLLDELVFPVLRKHGMRVEWNRNQATRILLTGARWYAPVA